MYVHGEYAKASEKGVNSVKIEGEVKIQESEPESEMTAIDQYGSLKTDPP